MRNRERKHAHVLYRECMHSMDFLDIVCFENCKSAITPRWCQVQQVISRTSNSALHIYMSTALQFWDLMRTPRNLCLYTARSFIEREGACPSTVVPALARLTVISWDKLVQLPWSRAEQTEARADILSQAVLRSRCFWNFAHVLFPALGLRSQANLIYTCKSGSDQSPSKTCPIKVEKSFKGMKEQRVPFISQRCPCYGMRRTRVCFVTPLLLTPVAALK